ncbi:hypothetical protein QFZ24_001280 [Streptomyces phaeochromogenes]|jgi:hypothetical protein|uniref:hypothetical protein n=1 Tax=Streptomyces phaeochromogenes TaxID=1923 RepID=UPI0027918531|nr:hypothetical protein [Streptomyces phaeochromogenes]MDQ0947357.1 hypothetical protein [Streptomyces phaeochromogenes]
MSELAWVPQSCTLPAEERPLRVAEWDALFAEQLAAVPRSQPLTLRLELKDGPGVVDQVRDLAEREGGCCSFFTFTVTAGEDGIVLDISVDAVHEPVLDALAVRAGEQVSR